MNKNKQRASAFTIVELLVLIVIIGILSAITIVSYSGVQSKATAATIQSDLDNISKQIKLFEVDNGLYPNSINDCPTPSTGNMCLRTTSGNTFGLNLINNTSHSFCITVQNGSQSFYINNNSAPMAGACAGASVSILAVGGGGSGAASTNGGTGGSGGSVVADNVSVGGSTQIIIGDGGTSVSGDSNGNNGGDTYFGSTKASGGVGGVVGSSTANGVSGTQSSISGSTLYYGGSGGSSDNEYTKTAGGNGGGGGGVTNYGDGSNNTITNGYAGLVYGQSGLCGSVTASYKAGNFYPSNCLNLGAIPDNSQLNLTKYPMTQHLSFDTGNGSWHKINTDNTLIFSPQIGANRQVLLRFIASGMTSSVSFSSMSFYFDYMRPPYVGGMKTLAQAVADGYIEPMVLINSASNSGNYYWSNITNIFSGSATTTGNYPQAGVVFTLKNHTIYYISVSFNKAFNTFYDGLQVSSWDRLGGLSMAPPVSIDGTNGLGGGGGANTSGASGSGGSGEVVVSYPTGSINATGGVITTANGNTIHTFTSNGSFVVN